MIEMVVLTIDYTSRGWRFELHVLFCFGLLYVIFGFVYIFFFCNSIVLLVPYLLLFFLILFANVSPNLMLNYVETILQDH